jgi:endonuclease YncB( thermonuclease family)
MPVVLAGDAHPPLVCLRGELVVVGKEPDGDSIRFVPDTPALLRRLRSADRIRRSSDGSVQLRLDGIDAPETHYGALAQPLGTQARDALLDLCGFITIERDAELVTAAEPERIAAAALSGLVDPNGRPVALLAVGSELPADGSVPALGDELFERTLNVAQLRGGDGYLTLYRSTAPDLRDRLRDVAREARDGRRGVWARDATARFTLRAQADIGPGGQLVLPKLFRRCSDYLRTRTAGETLADWLRTHGEPGRPEDDEVIVGGGERTRLSELVAQDGDRIAFPVDLLDLVFIEK